MLQYIEPAKCDYLVRDFSEGFSYFLCNYSGIFIWFLP